MKWKSTVVLLAAAIGIGAYISLYELKQPTPAERQRQSKSIVNLKPETVTQIVLDLPKAKTTLIRNGASWTLSPHNIRADSALISQSLNELSPLMSERMLTGAPGHPLTLKEFGLDAPVGWVSLVADGSTTTLLFGDETPVGNSRYLKVSNRPEVFIVPSRLFSSIDQPLDTFRDHAVIRVSSWLCQELTVTSPTSSYHLTRSGNDWRLTKPVADLADRSAVASLLSRLEQLQIKRFVNDEPPAEQLAKGGLDHPKTALTVRAGDPPTETTLFFGKPLPDDATLIYAKRSDERPLYVVAVSDLGPFLKNPNEWRAQGCFEFFTGNVTKVSAQWSGTTWTILRGENGAWTQEGSETALDRNQVESFLNTLADARIVNFADDTGDAARLGLDKPAGTISVWTSDRTTSQQVEVGALLRGAKIRYGRIAARSVIVTLPEALVTALSTTTPEQLKATPPASGSALR